MLDKLKKIAMITGSAAMLSTGALAAVPKVASASTTSTLLTAAGVLGALVLYNNYQHKRQAANQVVGYTANGGTIFGDGRVQLANGQTVYPNSNGQYPGGQYAYYNPRATTSNFRYDYNRTGQFDTTGRHRNNGNGFNGTGNNNASWHRNNVNNVNNASNMRGQDDHGRKHDNNKDKDKDKDHR